MLRNNFKKISNVEFIKNEEYYIVGIETTIRNRKEINKKLQKLDKKLDYIKIQYDKSIYIFNNYEISYKENNISCFIGRIILESDISKDVETYLTKKRLKFYCNDKVKTCLHAPVLKSLLETYKEIIEFANINDIQIRGCFEEHYNKNNIDVYVEAYDLLDNNLDEEVYNKNKLKKLENSVIDNSFVGKWQLVTEIFLTEKFKRLKKYDKPKTDIDLLIINSDGTTNIRNTFLKENYLITKSDDFVKINSLRHIGKSKKYIVALISPFKKNARAYTYIYKKVK